jgi:hypothetical protein
VLFQRLQDYQPAQAVPDEMRRADRARVARKALGVRRGRPRAPRLAQQEAAETRGMQSGRKRRHHHRGYPQAMNQDHVAHCGAV